MYNEKIKHFTPTEMVKHLVKSRDCFTPDLWGKTLEQWSNHRALKGKNKFYEDLKIDLIKNILANQNLDHTGDDTKELAKNIVELASAVVEQLKKEK